MKLQPAFIAGVFAVNGTRAARSTCTDFVAHIHAESPSVIIPAPPPNFLSPLDATNFLAEIISDTTGAVTGTVGNKIQSGDFDISMRYCKPTKIVPHRAKSIQVFVHGVSYNKEYWHGEGNTDYSWVDYALAQGYPTLTFDDLGSGNSTHADPLFVAQQPMRLEVLHQIILKLRGGTLARFIPKASKIIFVGHSHGAVEGNALAMYHPGDADTVILTGYSTSLIALVPRLLANFPLPALLLKPNQYHTLQDLLYLTFPTIEARRNFFYTSHTLGDYDEAVLEHDFATEDVIPLMQVITVFYGYGLSPNFTGPVLAMAGQRDGVFCNAIPNPDCGQGDTSKVAETREYFPNARDFQYHVAPRTAHSMNYFDSAQDSFKIAHDFLAKNGF